MPARVLVVEDNAANLELMTYLLRAFGHEPLTATDGEVGYETARLQSPDLIVCDIQLPKMDGYEVARQLKQHPSLRKIPLVAVTAFAMVGDRDHILAAGFDGYIAKPIEPEDFVRQVDGFLPADRHSSAATVFAAAADVPAPLALPHLGTVLIVDDVASNLAVLQSMLEPSGYTTFVASTVAEALDAARAYRPDLILSDLHMPVSNGRDLLDAVLADAGLRSIPLVLISSTGGHANVHAEAVRSGAVRFLLRPIEPPALLAEIAAYLSPPKEGPRG